MARVKRGTMKNKRRKNILAQTKGYRFDRKSKERVAHEAIRKAGQHAFRDRKNKKRLNKGLWAIRINAAARPLGMSFSKLLGALNAKGAGINKKTLGDLAMTYPEAFARVVQSVK